MWSKRPASPTPAPFIPEFPVQKTGENPMNREPVVGECVVVRRNSGVHNLRVGQRIIVSHVDDDDSSLRGIPSGGTAARDEWIPWRDVEPVVFGWDYCKGHLSPELLALFSACEGVEHLALNRQIKEHVVDQLPDWKQRILAAVESLAEAETDDA